jgi:glucose/arabinose dehydrogenase
MSDKIKYPDSIAAIWNSGDSTIAVSGLTVLGNEHWGAWYNRVVMAVLKNKHLRLIDFDKDGKVVSEKELYRNEFGRIRSVREGPDGNLYVTTDNGGSEDKIIRLSPQSSF